VKRLRWIPILVLATLVAGIDRPVLGAATDPAGKPRVDDDSLYDAPGRTVFAPRRAATPFKARIAGEEAAARARIAALSVRLAQATPAEAPSLARQIEAAKREHDAHLMVISIERARALGLSSAVAVLQRRLDDLRSGPKGGR